MKQLRNQTERQPKSFLENSKTKSSPGFDRLARFSVGDVERLGQLGEALVDVSLFNGKDKN